MEPKSVLDANMSTTLKGKVQRPGEGWIPLSAKWLEKREMKMCCLQWPSTDWRGSKSMRQLCAGWTFCIPGRRAFLPLPPLRLLQLQVAQLPWGVCPGVGTERWLKWALGSRAGAWRMGMWGEAVQGAWGPCGCLRREDAKSVLCDSLTCSELLLSWVAPYLYCLGGGRSSMTSAVHQPFAKGGSSTSSMPPEQVMRYF